MRLNPDIVDVVCEHFEVSPGYLLGRCVGKKASWPRMVVYVLARDYLGYQAPRIGALMERDHTTVLYGWSRVAELAGRDKQFADRYERSRRDVAAIFDSREDERSGPVSAKQGYSFSMATPYEKTAADFMRRIGKAHATNNGAYLKVIKEATDWAEREYLRPARERLVSRNEKTARS